MCDNSIADSLEYYGHAPPEVAICICCVAIESDINMISKTK